MNDDALVSRIRRDSMPVTESGCWIWMKCVLSCGYGQIVIARKPRSAHRTSYEVFRGPIPEGLQLDHLCRVRSCVNPDHLEAVTARENTLRTDGPTARNARLTHCKRGHEFLLDNVKRRPSRPTERACRTCEIMAARDARKRAEKRGVA